MHLPVGALVAAAVLLLVAPAVAHAGPPETYIDSGPSGQTTSTDATFTFHASQGGATFQCSLDGSAYASCTSPKSYTSLALGTHTFAVRATTRKGTDPTPATRTWEIVAPPPPGDPLQLSYETDRSPSVDLEGASVSGSACVFLAGHSSEGPVSFYLDGAFYHTESIAPWDFGGGSVDLCTPVSFGQAPLGPGSHTITATWTGGQDSSTFTVPAPPGTVNYGFHEDLGYFGDASFWNPRLDATQAIGSTVSRGALLWDVVEPSNDAFDFSRYDALVAAIEAHGMVPVLDLLRSPNWANGSTDRWVVPTDQAAFDTWVSEYAEFAGQAAARYAGRGMRYEVWNEPNEVYFWKPTPSIDRYAQLFTAARTAILAADPSARVGLGGITGLGASCCIRGLDFIGGLVDRGVQFDYAGIHPYVSQLDRGPDTHVDGEQNFDDTLAVHNLLDSRGRTGVKLWLTEWGWYECYPDDATKAAWLRRGLERIRDEWGSFVSISAYFMDVDTADYPCAGAFRSDLTRKPLADAFDQFTP
jgi:hypothetical protein